MLTGCAHFTTDTKNADPEKRDDLQFAYLKFQQCAYDDVIGLVAQTTYWGGLRLRAAVPVAQAYVMEDDSTTALEEYKSIRRDFLQTAHCSEGLTEWSCSSVNGPPRE